MNYTILVKRSRKQIQATGIDLNGHQKTKCKDVNEFFIKLHETVKENCKLSGWKEVCNNVIQDFNKLSIFVYYSLIVSFKKEVSYIMFVSNFTSIHCQPFTETLRNQFYGTKWNIKIQDKYVANKMKYVSNLEPRNLREIRRVWYSMDTFLLMRLVLYFDIKNTFYSDSMKYKTTHF